MEMIKAFKRIFRTSPIVKTRRMSRLWKPYLSIDTGINLHCRKWHAIYNLYFTQDVAVLTKIILFPPRKSKHQKWWKKLRFAFIFIWVQKWMSEHGMMCRHATGMRAASTPCLKDYLEAHSCSSGSFFSSLQSHFCFAILNPSCGPWTKT